MGSTYVEFNSQGFWMRDSVLELWMRFVAMHFPEPTKGDTLISPIRDQWLLASRGYFQGCIPIDLDANLSTEEGRKLVVGAIESLLVCLRKAPEKLNKDVLNLLGVSGVEYLHDIDTWRFIEVGESFLALIAGDLTGSPDNAAFMPGTGEKGKRSWENTDHPRPGSNSTS